MYLRRSCLYSDMQVIKLALSPRFPVTFATSLNSEADPRQVTAKIMPLHLPASAAIRQQAYKGGRLKVDRHGERGALA